MPLTTGFSARDCSASSSVSMSYDDVSSGRVENSLLDVCDVNERDESECDESVRLVVRSVLTDRNAVFVKGVIDERIVREEDPVARSATVSEERAGGIARVIAKWMTRLLKLAVDACIHWESNGL